MISEFTFKNAEGILPAVRRIVRPLARLRTRAHAAGTPVIYVNDTAGRWESDPQAFIDRCAAESARGHEIARVLRPEEQDYFIFKPRHSAFFETPFETLLKRLHVDHLLLTGMTSHQCVLFTAMDAHVREFSMTVASDCIAASERRETQHALFIMKRALNAKVGVSTAIRLKRRRR